MKRSGMLKATSLGVWLKLNLTPKRYGLKRLKRNRPHYQLLFSKLAHVIIPDLRDQQKLSLETEIRAEFLF